MSKTKALAVLIILCTIFSSNPAKAYYNAQQGRFLTQDPTGYLDGMNFYEYVSSDPLGKFDPYGLWKIKVDFPKEDRWYAGDLVLYDDDGKPLFYAVARGQGAYVRRNGNYVHNREGHRISLPWWVGNGDTPTGKWKGEVKVLSNPTKKRKDQFGPGKRIQLTAKSGNAKRAVTEFGRFGFFIHGGRTSWQKTRKVNAISRWEAIYGNRGEIVGWKPIWNKQNRKIPANTQGCIRLTNHDMKELVSKIESLTGGTDCVKKEKKVGEVIVTGRQPNPPNAPR